MRDLPDNYTLQQAFNDIMALGIQIREINYALSEWSEFITLEMLKDQARNSKEHRGMSYFKKHLSDSFKEIYDKFEDVYGKFNTYFDKKRVKGIY